jgi:pimeloyl-ACP methyl ester carboxylesterase
MERPITKMGRLNWKIYFSMKIAFQEFGNPEKQAVVLIHPFPFNSKLWEKVANVLANDFYVVTPDLRGCGETELGLAEPDLDLLASDVAELINELKINKPIVGGISLGGYVAMALARLNPNLMSGLILLDTKASADTESARENRFRVARQMKESGKVELFAEQMLENVIGSYTHENRPEVVQQVKTWMLAAKAETIAWLQIAMANRVESFTTLETFDHPTLLIRGIQDLITTAEDFDLMAKNLRQVTNIQISNAGHLPPIEDPSATAQSMYSWLLETI